CNSSVVVRVIVDEDRAVLAGLVVLLGVALDGRGHFLNDHIPLAVFRGGNAGVVVVVPRRECRSGGEKDCQSDRDRAGGFHGFVTSFSSSSIFTVSRLTDLRTCLPASTVTLIVCDLPLFGLDMVTAYWPGSSLMLVGVDLSSSVMSIDFPLSSTIFSSSPHGDAESSRTPFPAGIGAVDVGAVLVTTVVLTGATGVGVCLFFQRK